MTIVGSTVGKLVDTTASIQNLAKSQKKIKADMKRFCFEHKVPPLLQTKILAYVATGNRRRGKFDCNEDALSTLSDDLKRSLRQATYEPYVSMLPCFELLSVNLPDTYASISAGYQVLTMYEGDLVFAKPCHVEACREP